GTDCNCDVKYMSNNQYRSDYPETTIIWVDKEITSQATVNRDFGKIKNTLTLERKVDFGDTTTFEKIPYYTVTTPSNQLFSLITYSFSGHVVYDRQTHAEQKTEAGGANIHTSPGFKQNILDLFSVSPGVDLDLAVFKEDTLGNKYPARFGYSFITNASTNLYRVFSMGLFGIKGILHKVMPGISYRYTPDFDFGRFPSVSGIPSYSKTSSIGFSLNQEFEAKVGDKNEKKNFAQIFLGSGYNLLNDTISPINFSVNLPLNPFPKPVSNFSTRIGGSYNLYTRDYTYTIDHGTGFQTENFKISITQNYTYTKQEKKYQIWFNGEIKPTRNWLVAYSARYDYQLKKIVDYNISLTRNLHCWEGVFSFAQLADNWRYDFKVRIKEIPEVAIGRGLLGYLIE
ncbi:MAG: putative LPS assembly protein LptD, partial [candidate division WOR-3 bacterium]